MRSLRVLNFTSTLQLIALSDCIKCVCRASTRLLTPSQWVEQITAKKKGNQMERNCLWKGSQLEKKQCKLCASRWAGAEFPLLGKHKDDKEVRQGTLVLQPLFYELHFFNFGKEILGNYDHLWWSLTDILVCSYYKLILQNDLYLYIWYAPMGQARCHVFILVWQISWEELGI